MIVGIAGSGREKANSGRLLAEALAGARQAGFDPVRTYQLSAMTYRGCTGCGACRRDAEACVLRDDLTPVLEATAAADALVLASPIYYGYPSGLFKSYLDRWYSFRDAQRDLRTRQGRSALLILTQGHPEPEAYAWTLQSLEKVLTSYGFRARTLVASGLEAPEEVIRKPDLLARAHELGFSLSTF